MRFRNLNFDTKRVILYLEKHKKPKNGGKCKKMSKFTTFLFFVSAAAAVLLCGCRSDRYYQARAAERARAYLLENAPELDPQQCSFVRYNDPILLVGDGLAGRTTGVQQICVTWEIPGADRLYMVFGTSRERMDNWYPNRLVKRNFVKDSAEINSAVKLCRDSAITGLREILSKEDLNIIRFSNPEIAVTNFELRPEESINNPNDSSINKFDEENVKEKAAAKLRAAEQEAKDLAEGKVKKEPVQISLLWKISDHRFAVFCGTAEDESLKSWKLNFTGIYGDYDTNMACKKFLKKANDYNTPIPVPETEKEEK